MTSLTQKHYLCFGRLCEILVSHTSFEWKLPVPKFARQAVLVGILVTKKTSFWQMLASYQFQYWKGRIYVLIVPRHRRIWIPQICYLKRLLDGIIIVIRPKTAQIRPNTTKYSPNTANTSKYGSRTVRMKPVKFVSKEKKSRTRTNLTLKFVVKEK